MIKFTKKSHITGGGSPNYLGGAYNVKLDGTNLLASGFSDGSLSIIDATDPEALSLLGALQGTGTPNYLNGASDIAIFTVSEVKYAAVVSYVDNALVIVNINNPAAPSLSDVITGAGSPNYLSGAYAVAVQEISEVLYAFVASIWDNALTIFNINNPADISHVSQITGDGSPNYLEGAHDVEVLEIADHWYAFVVSFYDNALSVFNVDNPAAPSLVASVQGAGSPNYLSGAHSIVVSEDYAYITSYNDNALVIYDISDPSDPTKVGVLAGEVYMQNPCQLCLAEGEEDTYIFLASYLSDAIVAVNVTTPASPKYAGKISGVSNYIDGIHGIAAGTSHCYITSYEQDAVVCFEFEEVEAVPAALISCQSVVRANAFLSGPVLAQANIRCYSVVEGKLHGAENPWEEELYKPVKRAYLIDADENEVEITEYVKDFDRILWQVEQQYELGNFTANNCRIELKNEDEIFDIDTDNYFTAQGRPQDGYKTPIVIKCGFYDDDGVEVLITVFYGLIIDIDVSTFDDIAAIDLQCVSRILRDTKCNNVGDRWQDQPIYGGILETNTTYPMNSSQNYVRITGGDFEDFPDSGYFIIDDEVVYYGSKSTDEFQYCIRACHGTVRASHTAGSLCQYVLDDGSFTEDRFFQFPVYPIARDSVESIYSSDGDIQVIRDNEVLLGLAYEDRNLVGYIDYERGVLELLAMPSDCTSLRATFKSVPRMVSWHGLAKRLINKAEMDTSYVEDVILSDRLGRYVPVSYGRLTHGTLGDDQAVIANMPVYSIVLGADALYLGIGPYLVRWDMEYARILGSVGSGKAIMRLALDTDGNVYGISRSNDLSSLGEVFKYDGESIEDLTDTIACYVHYGETNQLEGAQWKGFSVDDSHVWFLYNDSGERGLAKVPIGGGATTKYSRSVNRDSGMTFADAGTTIEFFYANGEVEVLQYDTLTKATGAWSAIGTVDQGEALVPLDAVYNPTDGKVYLTCIDIYDSTYYGRLISTAKGSANETVLEWIDLRSNRSKYSGGVYHNGYAWFVKGTKLAIGVDEIDNTAVDEATGHLYRIADNVIEDMGAMAYRPPTESKNPLRIPVYGCNTMLAARESDDSIYAIMCDETVRFNQDYGYSITRYSDTFSPCIRNADIGDRSIWDVLSELAMLANYELGVSRYGKVFFRKRSADKTSLTADIDADDVTVPAVDTTGFQEAGYVQIGDEVIKYTSKTLTSFAGCTRSQYESIAAPHDTNDGIWRVDHVIINTHNFRTERSARKYPNWDDIYNYIRVPFGDYEIVFDYQKAGESWETCSENLYGRREFNVSNSFLTSDDFYIADALAWRYYDFFSQRCGLAEIETRWQPQMDLGHQITIKQDTRTIFDYAVARIRRIEMDLSSFYIRIMALIRPQPYKVTIYDYTYM